ncbi:MAG: iron-containing redox enzyme family protein [Actinomycetota bacterium]
MTTRAPAVSSAMDQAVARHRLLSHPFYRRWSAGTLTVDDLSFYATQYWRQVDAFPSHLELLGARCEGEARSSLEENLSDEVEGDHRGLWRRFAAALDVDDAALAAAGVTPETAECVDRFREACATAPVPFALGMLYGYESQTPEVAAAKLDGLRDLYGIAGAPAEHFRVHALLDVEHRASLARTVTELTRDDANGRAEALAGAEAGAQSIWLLLDGVERTLEAA